MTHYETLGVAPTATPDEIKAAWRRASSAAHPDREGGSTERQQAVNRAYETLSDTARRARYDETGVDATGISIDEEARDVLLTLFQAAIDTSLGNWLREVSEMLATHRAGLIAAQDGSKIRAARLVRRSGKIKARTGENLVQMLIDTQLQQLNAHIEHVDRGLKVNAVAAAMLANYEGGEEVAAFYGDQAQMAQQIHAALNYRGA